MTRRKKLPDVLTVFENLQTKKEVTVPETSEDARRLRLQPDRFRVVAEVGPDGTRTELDGRVVTQSTGDAPEVVPPDVPEGLSLDEALENVSALSEALQAAEEDPDEEE